MVTLSVGSVSGFDTENYTSVDQSGQKRNGTGTSTSRFTWYSDTSFYAASVFVLNQRGDTAFFGRPVAVGARDAGFAVDATLTGTVDGMKLPKFLATWIANHQPGDDLAAHIFQGKDTIRGGHAAGTLNGYAGDDVVIGGAGNDSIIGGVGRDALTGGAGADHFVYRSVAEIPIGQAEVIKDFSHEQGDVIDLSRFDVDPETSGFQALTFLGQQAFSGDGSGAEVNVVVKSATVNLLQFDLDGDGTTDASLTVNTTTVLRASDLALPNSAAEPLRGAAFGEDSRSLPDVHSAGLGWHPMTMVHLA